MPQVAIQIDEETARRLDDAARHQHISRTAWIRAAIDKELGVALPESFFDTLGSWQDDREPEEILKSIRTERAQADRPALESD